MKTILSFALLSLFILLGSCQKSQLEYSGKIYGVDAAMCPCCGGYMLSIDGDDETFFRFNNLNESANSIDLGSIDWSLGPLEVDLDYILEFECPPMTYITITDIEKK